MPLLLHCTKSSDRNKGRKQLSNTLCWTLSIARRVLLHVHLLSSTVHLQGHRRHFRLPVQKGVGLSVQDQKRLPWTSSCPRRARAQGLVCTERCATSEFDGPVTQPGQVLALWCCSGRRGTVATQSEPCEKTLMFWKGTPVSRRAWHV